VKRMHRPLILAVAVLILGGLVYLWEREDGPLPLVAGMVRQTEVRIAPEINGRLVRILASPGTHVAAGGPLAEIDNPDVTAAVGAAEAALANAQAERDRVFSGVRPEEVEIAASAVKTAEATMTLAEQQNGRVLALAQRGFNSQAQVDQSNSSLAKAGADLDLKRAQWQQAKAGPTADERTVAEAKVAMAAAALATLRVRAGKTRLVAPVNGTVGTLVAEPGEVLTPGKPVLTFVPDGALWLAFTIREDLLNGLHIGSQLRLSRADGSGIDARLTELRPLGEFATWRAARAVGDHDLNSFRIRLDPVAATPGVAPGMTVLLTP